MLLTNHLFLIFNINSPLFKVDDFNPKDNALRVPVILQNHSILKKS